MKDRILKDYSASGNSDDLALINLAFDRSEADDLESVVEMFRSFALIADAIANEIEDSPEYDDPKPEEIHAQFVAEILPMVREQYEQDGEKDIPARCEAFNNWTDMLCKDGEISDTLYNNIEHPAECA